MANRLLHLLLYIISVLIQNQIFFSKFIFAHTTAATTPTPATTTTSSSSSATSTSTSTGTMPTPTDTYNPNVLINYDQLNWPTLCYDGHKQSPVDFPKDLNFYNKTNVFEVMEVQYNILNRVPLQIYLLSTFMVNATDLGYVKVKKNGYVYQYDAVNVHFHFPSEHSIGGHRGDLEIHILHAKNSALFSALNGNTTIPDPDITMKNLIISQIFAGEGTVDNNIIKSFKVDRDGPVSKLDLTSLPPVNKPYYYYEGSFTIPACDEIVHWVVNPTLEVMSKTQMLYFVKWMTTVYEITGNNRNIQKLNNRTLYYQDYPKAVTANSTSQSSNIMIKSLNYILLILLIVAIL